MGIIGQVMLQYRLQLVPDRRFGYREEATRWREPDASDGQIEAIRLSSSMTGLADEPAFDFREGRSSPARTSHSNFGKAAGVASAIHGASRFGTPRASVGLNDVSGRMPETSNTDHVGVFWLALSVRSRPAIATARCHSVVNPRLGPGLCPGHMI